jgi:hypothetical protein
MRDLRIKRKEWFGQPEPLYLYTVIPLIRAVSSDSLKWQSGGHDCFLVAFNQGFSRRGQFQNRSEFGKLLVDLVQ